MNYDPGPLLEIADKGNDHEAATRFGVHPRTIQRWRHHGHQVQTVTADRVCTRIGRHIDEMWPQDTT